MAGDKEIGEFDERMQQHLKVVQDHMYTIMEECPDMKDLFVGVNWREGVRSENTPVSFVHTNRKADDESIVQIREIIALLQTSIAQLVDRAFHSLIGRTKELEKELKESTSDDNQ